MPYRVTGQSSEEAVAYGRLFSGESSMTALRLRLRSRSCDNPEISVCFDIKGYFCRVMRASVATRSVTEAWRGESG